MSFSLRSSLIFLVTRSPILEVSLCTMEMVMYQNVMMRTTRVAVLIMNSTSTMPSSSSMLTSLETNVPAM